MNNCPAALSAISNDLPQVSDLFSTDRSKSSQAEFESMLTGVREEFIVANSGHYERRLPSKSHVVVAICRTQSDGETIVTFRQTTYYMPRCQMSLEKRRAAL